MKIYLIRHGRQCDTRCNVDVALSEAGFRQADLVGLRMKDWGIQKVYSSDMIRARQTAETANKHWNVEHEIVPQFRELNFGDMEGNETNELNTIFADFKARQDLMVEDLRHPGGESAGDLVARGMPALQKVAESGLECVAIATHGVWIRAIVCHVLGIDLAKWKLLGTTFENGSITQLDYHPETGRFTLERFNDFAHLEPYPELLRKAWGVNEN